MKIEKTTAKKLFKKVPEWFQEQLIKAFGEDSFKITEWKDIKTFEDACIALDIDPEAVVCKTDTADEAAYKKLKIVVRAINQGWVPDWNSGNQYKYWPWFNLSSGFGFSAADYDFGNAVAGVGSRLCFESREKSDYTATQFIALYKEFLTVKN